HSIIAVDIHAFEDLEQGQRTVPDERRLRRWTERDHLDWTSDRELLTRRRHRTVPFTGRTQLGRGEHLFEQLAREHRVGRKVHEKSAADDQLPGDAPEP